MARLESISQTKSKMTLLAKNDQNLTIFGILRSNNITIFKGLSKCCEELHAKNQKKYQTIKAVGPELTSARTHVRTRVNL